MTGLYEWWRVVDDLSGKHGLNKEQEASLTRLIFTALFRRAIAPLDKHGNVITKALELTRGKQDVYVTAGNVNAFFFDVEPKFVWKPRKKLGRPVSSCSLEAHLVSGKLKIDAIKAASQLTGNAGRPPHRGQVASRLANNFSDYKGYEASYIEKKLRVGWWKD